jgi:hypothetical protein
MYGVALDSRKSFLLGTLTEENVEICCMKTLSMKSLIINLPWSTYLSVPQNITAKGRRFCVAVMGSVRGGRVM